MESKEFERKDVEIDGLQFEIIAMPTIDAMVLDKRFTTLLIPAISGIKDLKEDTKIDLKLMAEAVATALGGLPADEFEKMLIDLLAYTRYKDDRAYDMNKEIINTKFRRKGSVLYKLILEVMKFNNFLPFELLGGLGMEKINSLLSQTKKKKKPGSK